MDDKVFEILYLDVRINAGISMEIEAVRDAVTLVIVKTRSGSAYKIAALKFKSDTGLCENKNFEVQPYGLIITTRQYTAAIPWSEVVELYTEQQKLTCSYERRPRFL